MWFVLAFSSIFSTNVFWYFFFVQAADGGLDFRVMPTAAPSEQSTSTGKDKNISEEYLFIKNKQKCKAQFI